jgi:DNA repair exonuclease SbcCD ATPase subunit
MPGTPILSELLRQSAESGKGQAKEEGQDESSMPLFWRVFGGTLLSIAALVGMTVYQSLTGSISELRNDMGHLSKELHKEMERLAEAQNDLMKKDEVNSHFTSVWTSIRELKEDRKDLTTLKERCKCLADLLKAGEDQRRQAAEKIQSLREEHVASQERRVLLSELGHLRERLATLEGGKAMGKPAISPVSGN